MLARLYADLPAQGLDRDRQALRPVLMLNGRQAGRVWHLGNNLASSDKH